VCDDDFQSRRILFQDLPLGNYTIVVSAAGFQTVKIDAVRVSAGAIYTLPVKLGVAEVSSAIEVSAAALSLYTTATTLTTVVPSATLMNRLLNGRDFVQMIAVSPGFSGYAAGATGSVNGARANQVNWQIDGTGNNDQWWNIMAVNQEGASKAFQALSCRWTPSRNSRSRRRPGPRRGQPRRHHQPDHQVRNQPEILAGGKNQQVTAGVLQLSRAEKSHG
jgi:hypothetical protein